MSVCYSFATASAQMVESLYRPFDAQGKRNADFVRWTPLRASSISIILRSAGALLSASAFSCARRMR
eukprot:6204180-Pleurochrysis_carterae.AAC.2